MKTAGETLLSNLKSDTILKRKPFLKICSNHRRDEWPRALRFWDARMGTAVRDGKGWYKQQEPVVKNTRPKVDREQFGPDTIREHKLKHRPEDSKEAAA